MSPGYTGYTSASLVQAVKELSGGETEVVRDHGGPFQNGDPADDWVAALDADTDAGFDVLHLDVSKLPDGDEQREELTALCRRYGGRIAVEVGGERNTQSRLHFLLEAALKVCQPRAAVAALGGYIWADRQYGHLVSLHEANQIAVVYGAHQVAVKAHNLDWAGGRTAYDLPGFYNVAPEFANVEIDAWLHVLPQLQGRQILDFAYNTGSWRRWFTEGEGTWMERGRCALRYHLAAPEVTRILGRHEDRYVRGAIRDAILHG